MNEPPAAYGLWSLVILNSALFIMFAFTFTKPRTRRDWRSLGGFSAFVLAYFTEMYGFPLTIYLLLPWLTQAFPGTDFLSHDAGHLFEMMFGRKDHPHFGPFHLASYLFILGGFVLLSSAWKVLHDAQRRGTLATTGPYALIRHPQYAAFVLIMFGFLLQWPTLITLALFPILAWMYVRLARAEERDAAAQFGAAYEAYRREVPGFIPAFRRRPVSRLPP